MSVIEIRKVQREGARVVLGLAGTSGSGKTYTAIQLAYGLANGDGEKVGFLDTENRRGSLYADIVNSPFLIGDLYAPFSPQRYIESILAFQKAGVEVLVIDSVSHEWEGTGGCEEIANSANSKVIGWANAKGAHKRFMNVLLQSNMHVIVCLRAREKIDFSDPKNPVKLGVQPICEKNFMFEMTASLLLDDQGRRQTVLKCPEDLRPILGRGAGFIGQEDGRKLRAWIDGAKQLDPEVEQARNTLQTVTERGTKALEAAWKETPSRLQKALGSAFLAQVKTAAAAHDNIATGGVVNEGAARFAADAEDEV
jgi:ABC-type dipeptide/oligopeptide/nickel transport system ATPase component